MNSSSQCRGTSESDSLYLLVHSFPAWSTLFLFFLALSISRPLFDSFQSFWSLLWLLVLWSRLNFDLNIRQFLNFEWNIRSLIGWPFYFDSCVRMEVGELIYVHMLQRIRGIPHVLIVEHINSVHSLNTKKYLYMTTALLFWRLI